MKCKKIFSVLMIFILATATCTTAYAQNIETYTPDKVYYESATPEPPAKVARAIWMTYEKEIILEKHVGTADPSMSDFPQTVFYREPNPSGYGADATGTLSLYMVSKMYPRDPKHDGYYCSYRGTMGYFLE